MILLIDNYDSFSYNLVQLVGSLAAEEIVVVRNDEMTVEEIRKAAPSRMILSPGPGRPADAGILEEAVAALAGQFPIMGVCLGHQGICEAFGATVTYAKRLMHGKQSIVDIDLSSPIFKGLSAKEPVARYHSLAVDESTLPETLKVTSRTQDGEVMSVEHTEYPVFGLQFHPESVLTPNGAVIMRNFLAL